MYGGSTITQQLARTFFLIPKKLLICKYAEVLISFEMELFLSKHRILELYLNYCEWGKGIFGIEQASKYYYNKNVNKLSIDEASRLIAILASPIKNSVDILNTNSILTKRYNLIKLRYYTIKFRYYTYMKFHGQKEHDASQK